MGDDALKEYLNDLSDDKKFGVSLFLQLKDLTTEVGTVSEKQDKLISTHRKCRDELKSLSGVVSNLQTEFVTVQKQTNDLQEAHDEEQEDKRFFKKHLMKIIAGLVALAGTIAAIWKGTEGG